MGLARTASGQLVAAHLLRAGLEGGLATIAFNLRRMAAGPVRDDLATRAARLDDARPGRRRPHPAGCSSWSSSRDFPAARGSGFSPGSPAGGVTVARDVRRRRPPA